MIARNLVPKRIAQIASVLLGAGLGLVACNSSLPPLGEQVGAPASSPQPAPSLGGAQSGSQEILVNSIACRDRRRGADGLRRMYSSATPITTVDAEAATRPFPGMRPGGSTLLSQVQTGEELWVIQTASAETSTEDTEPGSGTMLALVAPERGVPATEVPLPLRHTDVKAAVAGYIATVDVTQQFHNPYDEKIEAVYVFPLPTTRPSTSS